VFEVGVFDDGDVKCVENLLKPARKTLKLGLGVASVPYEKRIEIWSEIRENLDRYLDEECGRFLQDLDIHFQSQFYAALLTLAWSFKRNGEDFEAAEMFSEREIGAIEKIERYNVFEILTVEDIMKKIVNKDEDLLGLFRDYYVEMDVWIDSAINDPGMKLPVRSYLKWKWGIYKGKINEALSKAISELDWFRKLVSKWEREAEKLAIAKAEEVRAEVESKAAEEIGRERERIEELQAKIDEAYRMMEEREEEIRAKEEEIRRVIEEIRAMKEKTEKGTRFVGVGSARNMELNFIGRIERKIGSEITILGRNFKVESVREGSEVDTSAYLGKLSSKEVKNLPENRFLEISLVEKKLLGSKMRMTLKAVFSSRVERYAEYGFDTDPLELTDVNAHIVDARDYAKARGERVVLCIASPTGFSSDVLKHINSEDFHLNFTSKLVSLCLLDLETGELVYNQADEVIKELIPIFRLERDEELIAKMKKCVEEMMKNGYVVFEKALSFCNGEESVLKAAFYELEREKGFRVRYIEGVGLVLMK